MMLRSSKGNNWAIIQLVSCMNLVEHNSDLVIVSCDFKDSLLSFNTSISSCLTQRTKFLVLKHLPRGPFQTFVTSRKKREVFLRMFYLVGL